MTNGYYTLQKTDNYGNTISYARAICPAGSYCSGGEKTLCPAGHFGETTGLSTADCSGSCPAGYYCPEGSVSGTTNKCGSVDKYCPAGSSAPTDVSEGYYSGPEDADVDVRSESTICPIGYYCTGGVKRPCPAGSYGTSEGLSSSTCTASCEAGYYCPGGDEKLECGSITKYCPAGSSAPSDVPDGYCSGPLTSPFVTRSSIFIPDSRHICVGGQYAVFSFISIIGTISAFTSPLLLIPSSVLQVSLMLLFRVLTPFPLPFLLLQSIRTSLPISFPLPLLSSPMTVLPFPTHFPLMNYSLYSHLFSVYA